MRLLPLLLASQLVVAAAAAAPSGAADNTTAPAVVSETRFGITLEDPDRWLEDLKSPATQQWIKSQATHVREVLDSIPARKQVLADVERLENTTSARIEDVVLMHDERLLIRRQEAGMETARLYVRDGWNGTDRLLVDPEDWKRRTGKPHAINYAVPSNNGKLAVVGLSESGSEMASAYVIDLATGAQSEAPITRVRYGVTWMPEDRGFFYNRENPLKPGDPANEHQLNSQAYLHVLGQDAERDRLVFGNRYDPALGIDPAQIPVVIATPHLDWLIGFPASTDSRATLFIAKRTDLAGEKIAWRKVVTPDDAVRNFVGMDNALYLLTARKANREIERLALDTGKRDVVVTEGALPIDTLGSSDDALFFTTKNANGVGMQLNRRPWATGAVQAVATPGLDTVTMYTTQEGAEGLVVAGSGWARFPDVVRVDAQGTVHPTGLQPPPAGVDASQLEATIVQVTSHDGAQVPLSIVRRRDLVRDGNNPTFMQGYGAYGISTEPFLTPAHFAYFDRGFVRAFCHVRGGGEKGESWYRAGFQATKANTWKDFIACAEYLLKEKYTSPARLGISGGSAGGVLIGNALIARPDLFAAVMPQVGVLDSVGTALRDPNGPVNWPEFGDPNTEAGFKSLLGMSAYQKVHDGTAFPAVMLSHGFNDPRVAVWNSAKFAARLQRATNSGKPVLLNIDYDAGHGIGSAQSSVNRERADLITFMLWQFGVDGYAPTLASASASAAPAMAQHGAHDHGEHAHGPTAASETTMDADHGLGTLSFPTSTQVPQAQEAFERGMRWLHLFEYEQARDAFVEAEKLDKDFSLAYWGESLTYVNGIWHMDEAAGGRAALAKLGPTPEARAAKATTPREKAFLDTAEQLFGKGTIEERQTRFLDAATKLAHDYPDDDEAQLIRALALFGADPKGRNAANYAEAARLSRKVLAHNPQHGGAAHYLIHATDDPTNASEGLAAARALSGIGPMSSHAQHMTSHIFFALGLWDDAIAANREAIRIDEAERAKRKLPPGRCGHYSDWLQYAYYQAGRLQEARQVFADCVQDNGAMMAKAMMRPDLKPDDLAMRQAELLDSLIDMHATALVESKDPTREAAIRIDTGNIGRFGGADLFARGYVAAVANDLPTARTLLAQLQAMAAQPAAKDEYDPHLGERLSIQADMLQALIDAGEGRMDPAIARVREAAKRSDAIPFQFGPPRDVKPPHELAGELLMRQGRSAEALAEFDASLESAPNRAQSLLGRARALKAMGETARADAAMDVLQKQWHAADATVVSQSAAR